jgi:hypothetical protein
MQNLYTFPQDSYVTVRGLSSGWWSSIIARNGSILAKADFSHRTDAFQAAKRWSDRLDLPCLVEVQNELPA